MSRNFFGDREKLLEVLKTLAKENPLGFIELIREALEEEPILLSLIPPPSTADLPPVPPEAPVIKLGGLWKDQVGITEREGPTSLFF